MAQAGSQADVGLVYQERNLVAMALAEAIARAGGTAGWLDNAEDPDWPILLVDLPTGQVSWHIPADEAGISDVGTYPGIWDEHDHSTRDDRLELFVRDVP